MMTSSGGSKRWAAMPSKVMKSNMTSRRMTTSVMTTIPFLTDRTAMRRGIAKQTMTQKVKFEADELLIAFGGLRHCLHESRRLRRD